MSSINFNKLDIHDIELIFDEIYFIYAKTIPVSERKSYSAIKKI